MTQHVVTESVKEQGLILLQNRFAVVIYNLSLLQGQFLNLEELRKEMKNVRTDEQISTVFCRAKKLYKAYLSKILKGVEFFKYEIELRNTTCLDDICFLNARINALLNKEPPKRPSQHSIYTVGTETDVNETIDSILQDEYTECARKDYIKTHWNDYKVPRSKVYLKRV